MGILPVWAHPVVTGFTQITVVAEHLNGIGRAVYQVKVKFIASLIPAPQDRLTVYMPIVIDVVEGKKLHSLLPTASALRRSSTIQTDRSLPDFTAPLALLDCLFTRGMILFLGLRACHYGPVNPFCLRVENPQMEQ